MDTFFSYDITLWLALMVSALVTAVAMPYLIWICRRKRLFDMPDERKVHSNAIPRLGGVLFLPAALIAIVVAVVFMEGLSERFTFKVSTIVAAVGVFLIYLVGLIDDLVGMKAYHKFMVQLLAALAMPLCGLLINNFYGLFGLYELPCWFSYPLTVFVILLIINSINLIDGIDGLSSALCICILSAFAYFFYQLPRTFVFSLICMAVVGSLLAFFYFNMFGKVEKGTKTFMGDSGSLFLGYLLAYISIKYASDAPSVLPYRSDALFVSYTLLVVPTFDLVRVALTRLMARQPIFLADKRHIHHRFMAAGLSMHQTWCAIMLVFLLYCVLNFHLYECGVPCEWIVGLDIAIFVILDAALRQIHKYRKTI